MDKIQLRKRPLQFYWELTLLVLLLGYAGIATLQSAILAPKLQNLLMHPKATTSMQKQLIIGIVLLMLMLVPRIGAFVLKNAMPQLVSFWRGLSCQRSPTLIRTSAKCQKLDRNLQEHPSKYILRKGAQEPHLCEYHLAEHLETDHRSLAALVAELACAHAPSHSGQHP